MSKDVSRVCVNGQNGLTVFSFSKDGQFIFAGGVDISLRKVFNSKDKFDAEPEVPSGEDEILDMGAITCIDTCGDSTLVGSDSTVRRFKCDGFQLIANVASVAGLPVQCIAVDPKGKKVAVGSEDKNIIVVDLEDALSVEALEEHQGGVRKVSWHPKLPILLVCGANGVITAWDLSTSKEPKVLKKLDGIIPAVKDTENIAFLHDCTGVWHPSGSYFVAITKSHEVVTISYPEFEKKGTFSDKQVTGTPTALAISVNGSYLATAVGPAVYVWSTSSRRLVTQYQDNSSNVITQLAFSPMENLLAWTDNFGFLTRWPQPIPSTLPSPVTRNATTNAPSTSTMTNAKKDGDWAGWEGDNVGSTDDVDDDLENEWASILDKGARVGAFPGTEGDDDGDVDMEVDVTPRYGKPVVNLTEPQPAFQPGSTPMEKGRRYLAFNTLGSIDCVDRDDHFVYTIDFWDKSNRRGQNFNSTLKYDMAYLGERGAVFACPPEHDHTAQVTYKPYGSWAASKVEWTYDLSRKGVQVLGVAAGSVKPSSSLKESVDGDLQGFGHVVVATDEGDLTFLSGTGRERRIMPLGGDFVTMTAGADWVFVVYRVGGTTVNGSQNLSYCIVNVEDFTIRQRDVLPLPKDHTLTWVGTTSEGAPAMYDSSNRLHILTKYRIPHHASWARILDASLLERRQGKDESYWPLGIEDNTFLCIILKGREQYPGFPKPVPQDLAINLPFRSENAKEELIEREMLLRDLSLDALDDELTSEDIIAKERAIDKEFIQLIQAACKNDNIPRAIELCRLLHNPISLDAAVKVARFYQLPGFEEKVLRLKVIREENEDRMVLAREKRRRWNQRDAVARRLPDTEDSGYSFGNATKPFQDFGPPPAIDRPGLERARPSVERSKYRKESSPPPWDEGARQVPAEGKRKRTPEMDLAAGNVDSSIPDEVMPPPPKQTKTSNPFARKQAQDTRNPFARKNDGNKIIQKTESFFEKVDAAESASTSKPKRGPKKDKKESGPRQATLFGMLPKQNSMNKTASKPPPAGSQATSEVSMSDASSAAQDSDMTLVSTQPTTDGWEETQTTETQE